MADIKLPKEIEAILRKRFPKLDYVPEAFLLLALEMREEQDDGTATSV